MARAACVLWVEPGTHADSRALAACLSTPRCLNPTPACKADGLHWFVLAKRTDPALVKRLTAPRPCPLTRLVHDGKRLTSATPMVEGDA
ncbi:MAG: hypothetical protein RL376_1066 [Verrucomicrobiota bacterium]|jgi:hypothetical protein